MFQLKGLAVPWDTFLSILFYFSFFSILRFSFDQCCQDIVSTPCEVFPS